MAHTTITGNLGKDPELKTSSKGTSYTRLSVAWSERSKDKTGEWTEGPTVWVSVTCFGKQAEAAATSLSKGDTVIIEGDLKPETWHSDQGERTVFAMIARSVSAAIFPQQVTISKPQRGDTTTTQQKSSGWGAPATNGHRWGADDNAQPPF